MTVVEHNDVDISKLFIWKKKFEVTDDEGNVLKEVYLRVPGDADLNRARVYALRRSAELRSLLRDAYSNERMAYIKEERDVTKEELINTITLFSMRHVSKEANDEVKLKKPKPPKSDASTEVMEKYQAEVDEYPAKRFGLVKERIEKKLENLENDLKEKDIPTLYPMYEKSIIDELCEQELLRSFKERATFFAVYLDEDLEERAFTVFDEFINLPSDIKSQFISAYESLEIYGEELKKLRQATQ